jgi:hypothetical protein
MPLQNRVTPSGDLIETAARGLLFGNRGGRFHDPATRRLGRRRWASRQWIACVLQFKDRHRQVWGNGYTELFFLDEVTALSAGHRPCFECRRADAKAFADAVTAGLGLSSRLSAPEMDRRLHDERLEGRGKRRHVADIAALPDGAVVEIGGRALAVRANRLFGWEPEGYVPGSERPAGGQVTVLTPPLIVAALKAGYRPLWHGSAGPTPAG